jgi:hypothetical protein
MPLAKDLTGLGFPALQSVALGDNPAVAVTAAGGSAAAATALLLSQNNVLMTATGTDGVRLPAGTPLQRVQTISNVSAGAGVVYPPTGSNFTGGTTDVGISVPSRKSLLCWRYSALGWAYNLSA